MSMLQLALQARLPLIHITTDDVLNMDDILAHISGLPISRVNIPEKIGKLADLKMPGTGPIFLTGSVTSSLPALYRYAVENEFTFIFVNVEAHVLMFPGGPLYPPQEMVRKFLMDLLDDEAYVEELLPCYGGLTLKDVSEVTKLSMTRDSALTPKGVNETRRGYAGKLRGIDQVDTEMGFYAPPAQIEKWLTENRKFFLNAPHPSLIPRGLLFDGPPGTGKTLASKHIARSFGIPLYRLDLGGMMGKYVGDSEGNLIAALAQIDQVAPCALLFDEVEKIFSNGGGDSGVSDRMLSQLLWWLQEHKTKVFSVMTTNDLKAIPAELYRPGRIDETKYFAGITNRMEGNSFGIAALEVMAVEIGHTLTKSNRAAFSKRIDTLFADGHGVPQATITQAVFTALKEYASLAA